MLIYDDEAAQARKTHNFEVQSDTMLACSHCGLTLPKKQDNMSFLVARVPKCTGQKEISDASANE